MPSLVFHYIYMPEHDYLYLTREGAKVSEVDLFTLAPPPHDPMTVHVDVGKNRELFGIEVVGACVSLPTAMVERLERTHEGDIDFAVEFCRFEDGHESSSEVALKFSEQPSEGTSRLTVSGDSLECICSWDTHERVVELRFNGNVRIPGM